MDACKHVCIFCDSQFPRSKPSGRLSYGLGWPIAFGLHTAPPASYASQLKRNSRQTEAHLLLPYKLLTRLGLDPPTLAFYSDSRPLLLPQRPPNLITAAANHSFFHHLPLPPASSLMAENRFWDDECLRGSIDQDPLPAPHQSFFETDLFCDEDGLDDLPPLPHELPPLPSTPELQATPRNSFPSSLPSPKPLPESTNWPPSPPPRQWGSFLDDNCPLRKRVKVTITQPPKRRDPPTCSASSSQRKKRRISPTRSASRSLQTTLCLPTPGDPSSRLTLHIPADRKVATRTQSQRQPSISIKDTDQSEPAEWQPSCISTDLNERLTCMYLRKPSASQGEHSLPFVEAAVQAVGHAAHAYSKAIATVGALRDAAAIVASKSVTNIVKGRKVVKVAKGRSSRKRRGKRKRTLLSFDDMEVASLMEEDAYAQQSALFRYINSPTVRTAVV